jgi:hypothetical protein
MIPKEITPHALIAAGDTLGHLLQKWIVLLRCQQFRKNDADGPDATSAASDATPPRTPRLRVCQSQNHSHQSPQVGS